MRGLGQIKELCTLAEPDYGIITNIGPVHLSELGTMQNIARAKWELADWLQEHQGLLVINNDNSWRSKECNRRLPNLIRALNLSKRIFSRNV